MRKAISVVLAALLIILPVEQVLAQAVQQEAVSVQQTTPDGAAALLRVPPLTPNAALLLRASSDGVLLESSLSNTDAVVGWSDWSNKKRTWIVVAFVAGLAAVVLLIKILCPDGCSVQQGGPV